MQFLQESTLHGRKLDVGAVAALEAWEAHWHLFALQACRDTTGENNSLDALQTGNQCVVVHVIFASDIHTKVGIPVLDLCITDLDTVFLTGLGINQGACVGGAPRALPSLRLAVHQYLEVRAALHVKQYLAGLLRAEYGLIEARESRQVYTGSESIVAVGGHVDRTYMLTGSHGFSLAGGVVPERAPEARLAVDAALVVERNQFLLVHQVAALEAHDILLAHLHLDTFQQGRCLVGSTVVVAPHQHLVVRIGPDHGNLPAFLQRKHIATVLQQHNGLACHVESRLLVFLVVEHLGAQLRPGDEFRIVHLTQLEATLQQAQDMLVHILLGNQPIGHSFGDAAIDIVVAAFHICAGQRATGSCQGGVARSLVAHPKVRDGTAVRDYHILEAPVVAQYLLEQTLAAAAGFVVPALIGAHHFTHIALLHTSLERGHIGLPEVARRDIDDVVHVTRPFRSTMDSIMLGTGIELAVLGVRRTLETLHHLHTHAGSKIRIFAIGLLSASPAWITEDVHVRCPHRQAMETGVLVTVLQPLVVGGTTLVAHLVEDGIYHLVVERGSHANRFWINSHVAHVGNAMKGFAPPVELLDAQAGNGIRHVEHQGGLLLNGQAAKKVFRTFARRQIGVLIRQHLLCRSSRREHQQNCNVRQYLFHIYMIWVM